MTDPRARSRQTGHATPRGGISPEMVNQRATEEGSRVRLGGLGGAEILTSFRAFSGWHTQLAVASGTAPSDRKRGSVSVSAGDEHAGGR